MGKRNDAIRVFEGSEIQVNLLKNELEKIGINSIVKNNFKLGLSAGFRGGSPSGVDLLIQESDLEKAKPVLDFFKETNKE